jgi:hypothetical protein
MAVSGLPRVKMPVFWKASCMPQRVSRRWNQTHAEHGALRFNSPRIHLALFANSTEQNLSWEADGHLTGGEIILFVWDMNYRYVFAWARHWFFSRGIWIPSRLSHLYFDNPNIYDFVTVTAFLSVYFYTKISHNSHVLHDMFMLISSIVSPI